jgi:ADP-ribose pyrophosphatase YjhB (NUDIX family)
MPLAACVAIFQNGKILLTKREDFEVWCLPGGGVEENESLPQSAIREAYEETGLKIQLTRLVGIYSRSMGERAIHSIVFAAEPIGGKLKPQVGEVIDMRYFAREEIDSLAFMADHHQRVIDAFDGVGGSAAWWHNAPWPDQAKNKQELYDLRDQSDLSRKAFYLQHFDQLKPGDGTLEVGKMKTDDQ